VNLDPSYNPIHPRAWKVHWRPVSKNPYVVCTRREALLPNLLGRPQGEVRRVPTTRSSENAVRRLSEKGCERRSGRVFGPSIGTTTDRFGALWSPRFGCLRDFSDSLTAKFATCSSVTTTFRTRRVGECLYRRSAPPVNLGTWEPIPMHESRNTQSPALHFRVLLTEGDGRRVQRMAAEVRP